MSGFTGARVRVDFNVRVHGGLLRARRSRVEGDINLGDLVEAFDPEDETQVFVCVAELDEQFVYLATDTTRSAWLGTNYGVGTNVPSAYPGLTIYKSLVPAVNTAA